MEKDMSTTTKQRKLTKAQNQMLLDCLNYGPMTYNFRARRTAMVLAAEGLVHVDNTWVPAGLGVMRKGIAVTVTEAAALDPADLDVDPDSEFADWRVWDDRRN